MGSTNLIRILGPAQLRFSGPTVRAHGLTLANMRMTQMGFGVIDSPKSIHDIDPSTLSVVDLAPNGLLYRLLGVLPTGKTD